MATFTYVAKDAKGKEQKGRIQAETKEAFFTALREKKLYCIHYTEYSEKREVKSSKIKLKQLVVFSRQFATMIESGVSLIKCIDILYQQTEDPKLKLILLNIYENVQKGNALSSSLKAQGQAFPDLFIAMVECGEESGSLDTTLARMATHYELENKLRNKVRNASIYPMILLVASIGVMLLLLLGVVPSFAEMFGQYGELPIPTQIMLGLSGLLRNHGLATLGVLFFIGCLIYLASRTEGFKKKFDQFKFTCPVIGKLNKIVSSARFAETTSTLYASGMSLIDVMEITQRVLGNTYLDPLLDKAREDVSKGIALSEAMKQVEIFPPMLPNMILIGEESGRLEEILDKTAQFYQEESDAAIQKMVSLMGPMMIMVLGLMVALIVGSILPPLYEMMGNIQ